MKTEKVFPKTAKGHYRILSKFAQGLIPVPEFCEYLRMCGLVATSAHCDKKHKLTKEQELNGWKFNPNFLENLEKTAKYKSSYFLAIPKLKKFHATGIAQWTIWSEGNIKLKFIALSSLPAITCEGAGDCLNWCYSFKAWRYVDAFLRQYQMTELLKTASGKKQIADALMKKARKIGEIRLYVDGDFDSLNTMGFFFSLMRRTPNIKWYGYSKSLQTFLDYVDQGGALPSNYKLNLSKGHKYSGDVVEKVKDLSIYRGLFEVVNMTDFKGVKTDKNGRNTSEYRKAIARKYFETTGRRGFACPNRCHDCTPKGHACGLESFKNVDVVAPIH